MDIKFIILLLVMVVCIVLIIMCMRDVDVTRKEMEKSFSDLSTNIDDKMKYLRNKQVSDNATIISKLQKENRELVQQVRKINLINNQTIRYSNEYATADTSETSANNPNFITYLSDNKNNIKPNKQENKSVDSKTSVFLSKSSTDKKKKNNKNNKKHSDSVEDVLDNLNENVIDWTVKKGNDTIGSNSIPDDEIEQDGGDESEDIAEKTKSHTSEKSINVKMDNESDENSDDESEQEDESEDESEQEESSEDNTSNNESDESEESEEDSESEEESSKNTEEEKRSNNNSKNSERNDEMSNDNSVVEGMVGDNDKNSVNIEVEFIGNKKVPKATDKELQKIADVTLLAKKIEDNNNDNSESDDDSNNESESFSKIKAQLDKKHTKKSNSEFKKLMESITIGSDSNKKSKKQKKHNSDESDEDSDSGILSESEGTFNSNGSLKSIDNYTVKELRELAKKFLVPISTHSDTGVRRSLKKSELYDKLSSCIKK